MNIWKYSGILFAATGVLHCMVALVMGGSIHLEIIRDGLINSVGEDPLRNYAFWSMVCGILIILFGCVLHHYIKKDQKPAPVFLGYSLLLFSIIGCMYMPVSGFWLFIPQALIIIIVNRKMEA